MFETIKEKSRLLKLGFKKTFAGQVMLLATAALGLGISAMIISFTAKVNSDVGDTLAAGTAKDASLNGTEGLGKMAENLGTVGTVVGIAVVILILMAAFGGFLTGKRGR